MKKLLLIISLIAHMTASYSQEEGKIWTEFISLVRNKLMTESRIKPLELLGDKYKPILLSYLDSIRVLASADDWTNTPEIVRNENRIQYIVTWSTRGPKELFCFSFVVINSQWFFQHLESIFIRLDKTSAPPVSTFPDISESDKAWQREEIYWSFIVQNIYIPLKNKMGKAYALDLLKDGGGYFVSAKTWVPFVSHQKAFILYLCWEQANLRGNNVTLESLSDTLAIVSLDSQFFKLYSNTGHLKTLISTDDYKQIFETIWHDRSKNAGWNLLIKYMADHKVTFRFYHEK